ncbi:ricin-type beta-trefoil lectin domain protein [Streptomyces sp. NPDC050504]|uniref:ricin-type beta-trefoil lectin domain protein n=1 Tax=Streptomyces sp. NPDC050504 TaxID=3365618 RepID=UPI00378E1480
MFLRSVKIASALALAIGAVGAGSVSQASAAPVPASAEPAAAAGAVMLRNVATGKCLAAASAGTAFAQVLVQDCNRYNGAQWWATYQDKLVEINNSNVCLVNQNGQPGTALCNNSSSSRWWYGANPSTLWSVVGSYLTTGGYTAWLGPNQGNYSQWTRVS